MARVYVTDKFSELGRFWKYSIYVTQEPEGSSPHSQQLATGPYPETVKSLKDKQTWIIKR
jgi:hypothetical protein